jgi:hypothetical protein
LYATVAGGLENVISGDFGAVGGGRGNDAEFEYATVAGGQFNLAGGASATVGGGTSNTIRFGAYTTIAGGSQNLTGNASTATGSYASVGGGNQNNAEGNYSTVPGGCLNWAPGKYSFAAGQNAHANHDRSFIWSSYSNPSPTFGPDTFFVSAANGIGINCGAQRSRTPPTGTAKPISPR